MAANVEEVVVSARSFPNVLALPVRSLIGTLEVETSLEEVHTDTLEVTKHPVEEGAKIADHSYSNPSDLVLRCGWSNASLRALGTMIVGALSGATMLTEPFVAGSKTRSDYVGVVYAQLLKMKQSREPISVSSSLRHYDNMLIKSLVVTRDQTTSQVLIVTATFEQVIIVRTRSTTLPPRESQASPADTAEIENAGARQVISADPAPGGTVPPNEW